MLNFSLVVEKKLSNDGMMQASGAREVFAKVLCEAWPSLCILVQLHKSIVHKRDFLNYENH